MRRFAFGGVVLAVLLALSPGVCRADGEGQTDLDEAIDAKVGANSLDDLSKVIRLCLAALDKGLDDANKDFAKRLAASTLEQRATALTSAILDRPAPDRRWPQLRRLALADLERAIELDPKQASAHILVARLNVLPGGDRKRATKAAEDAVSNSGDDAPIKARALVMRAGLSDDKEKQLADYNEAVKLHPENVETLRARGLYFLINGKNDKALNDFDLAIKADPKHVDTHQARGLSLMLLKRYDDAKKSFDAAIELEPDAATPHMHRARIFAIKGETKEALADLETALKTDPNNVTVLLLRARVHQQAGNTDLAKADVEAALKQRPGSTQALELRAFLFAGAGDFEQAIADVEELRKIAPDKPELLIQLGLLYTAAKKPQKAIESYSAAIKVDDKNWSALRGRGDALLGIGKQAEAVADYEAALKLKPKDGGLLNNLSWVLSTSPDEKIRDGKRALEVAKEACEATQYKQPHILSTLAAAYAELGDWENAIKWSKTAVELGGEESQQLKAELKSYEEKKPWREKQTGEEKEEEAKPEK